MDVEYDVTCRKCGSVYTVLVPQEVYDLAHVLYDHGLCQLCQEKAREQEEKKRAELVEERKKEILELNLESSNLRKYCLLYDREHRGANPELFSFIKENSEGCLWIAGKTGMCKTRIMQYFGRQMCRTRSVLYYPAMDLLSYLSENAKDSAKILNRIYSVELLILDDLGTETATEARMKYLFNIIDRRCIGFEQKKRGMIGRTLGAQLWISTNDTGAHLYEAMKDYAAPCIRRIQENCAVWEKFN